VIVVGIAALRLDVFFRQDFVDEPLGLKLYMLQLVLDDFLKRKVLVQILDVVNDLL